MLTTGAARVWNVSKTLDEEKSDFVFCESVLSLDEFIMYENLTDCPQIWPEDSPGIEHENRVRDLRFSKLISRNGFRRNTCRYIFDHQTYGVPNPPKINFGTRHLNLTFNIQLTHSTSNWSSQQPTLALNVQPWNELSLPIHDVKWTISCFSGFKYEYFHAIAKRHHEQH